METRQRDELELVAHVAQLFLERRDLLIVEFALPVEGGRAVVRQHLAGIFGVDGFRKFARFVQVGRGGFAPDQIHIRSEFEGACHGVFEPVVDNPETIGSAFAAEVFLVHAVNIAADERGAEASVRPMKMVGTPITSAARRAEINFCMKSWIGTSTLPPMCPHFFNEDSWSSR
jgi:hypothetical protein